MMMSSLMTLRARPAIALLLSLALGGCGILKELRKNEEDCSTESCFGEGEVGPEGGTIEADGLTLIVPEGALDDYVYIVIDTITHPVAPGIEKRSKVYNFSPYGTHFAKPVTVTIEAERPADELAIYWTLAEDIEEFERLPTKREGAIFRAEVQHFSQGFVGAPEHEEEDEDDEDEDEDDEDDDEEEGRCGLGYESHVEGVSGAFTTAYFEFIVPSIAERYVGSGAFWSGVGGGFPLNAEGELAVEHMSPGDRAGLGASFCSADGARSVDINYHPNDGLRITCGAEADCAIPSDLRVGISAVYRPNQAIAAGFTPTSEYSDELFFGLLTPRVALPSTAIDYSAYEWKLVAMLRNEAKIVDALTLTARDATAEERDYFGLDFDDDDD